MHHPDAKPESRPGDMGMMGQGGAMGGCMMGRRGGRVGDMMQMIQQMMTMMSVESGVMVAHVEGRIAELKSELKITDVQVPQWNRFADAMRSVAKSMAGIHHEVMEGRTGKTLPERLASRAKAFAAHLAVVKAMEDAL